MKQIIKRIDAATGRNIELIRNSIVYYKEKQRYQRDLEAARTSGSVAVLLDDDYIRALTELNENGLAKVSDLIPRERLEVLGCEIDNLFNDFSNLNTVFNDGERTARGTEAKFILTKEEFDTGDLRNKTNNLAINEPLLKIPGLLELASNDALLSIVSNYFDSPVYLGSVNVRKSFKNELNAYDTQYFHVDKNSHRIVKAFFYLNDVSEEGHGPFCYVKGSHRRKFFGWLRKHRWLDSEIKDIYGQKSFAFGIANVGDLVIADTTGMHKGLKPLTRDRIMITFNYVVHREFSENSPVFKVSGSDIKDLKNKNIFSLLEKV